jgi:hypothetical protein
MNPTKTVSELIEVISTYKEREDWPDDYRFEQHWISCIKQDLYNGGFNELDWNSEEGGDLDAVLSGAFENVLRAIYHFVPVLVNDDPET